MTSASDLEQAAWASASAVAHRGERWSGGGLN